MNTGNQPLLWRACREFCKIKCQKIWWVRKKVVSLQADGGRYVRYIPSPASKKGVFHSLFIFSKSLSSNKTNTSSISRFRGSFPILLFRYLILFLMKFIVSCFFYFNIEPNYYVMGLFSPSSNTTFGKDSAQ